MFDAVVATTQTQGVKGQGGMQGHNAVVATGFVLTLLVSGACAGAGDVEHDDLGPSDAASEVSADADGDDGETGGGSGTGGSAGTGGSGGTSGSAGTGTGGSGGTSGSAGTGGTAGAGGAPCDQNDYEPNDIRDDALVLPPISDCNSDGSSLDGTLAPGDVDWYSLEVSDEIGCSVDPSFHVTTAENVRLCAYFACAGGSGAEVTCPIGADQATIGGNPGCCTSFSPLEPDVNCIGTIDEAATLFLQVSWPGNSNCKDYSVEYHY